MVRVGFALDPLPPRRGEKECDVSIAVAVSSRMHLCTPLLSHEHPWVALSPGRILNPLFHLHFSSCPSGTVTWEGVLCWVPCVLLAESLREPDP